jgi:hypothetical protein
VRLWKWLGLAGIAGVAATGVVIARDQRKRAALTPDEVRERLHERVNDGGRGRRAAPVSRPPRRTLGGDRGG